MPFDGESVAATNAARRNFGSQSLPGNGSFDVNATRPTAQNNPLFGLDGAEWRGFFFGLVGVVALVIGLAAMLLSLVGN